jgi:hypothetical protein
MSNLLSFTRVPSKRNHPMASEFAVSPDTAPYLVTSTKALAWIPEPMEPTPELWHPRLPDHVVRVAVRPDIGRGAGFFYWEVIHAVAEMGVSAEWGNVHPFTEEGIHLAKEHVESYGLSDLCLLMPSPAVGDPEEKLPLRDIALDQGLLPQPCSWLPLECVVIVPKNREFVGILGMLGRQGSMALVHNPSRAIGIAASPESLGG